MAMIDNPELPEDALNEIEQHFREHVDNGKEQRRNQTYVDAMMVVNRVVDRRGDKPCNDLRPKDVEAMHNIVNILLTLYEP
jgi:hypothetical protein